MANMRALKIKTKRTKSKRAKVGFVVAGIVMAGLIGFWGYRLVKSHAYSYNFVYFSQLDSRWANYPYTYNIPGYTSADLPLWRSGCVPDALAMVESSLNNNYVPPQWLAGQYASRYHTPNGTSWDIFPQFARDYGLKYSSLGYFGNVGSRNSLKWVLNLPNSMAVVMAGPGMFTSSGHALVFRSFDSLTDSFLIADPYNNAHSGWWNENYLVAHGGLSGEFSFGK